MKAYYVYILASKRNGTLYTGVTSRLQNRVFQHRNKMVKGFTEKYEVSRLVYYEYFDDVYCAIHREKQLKRWRRKWKLSLIEGFNPYWKDLSSGVSVMLDPGSRPG